MARRTLCRRKKSDVIAVAAAQKRACAYVRVSTEEQADEGVSLDAQEDRVRAYAITQGLDLAAIYRDEGVSAGDPMATRPEGAKLLAAVASGEYAHVIAVKLDRCFRHATDCVGTVEAWTRARVAVHFIDMAGQAVDTRSPMGRFFLHVMAAVAEMELNQIRDRTRTALQHKKRHGDRLGAPPIGLTQRGPGATMVPNVTELDTVRRLLDLCDEDRPFVEVARTLTAEGRPTKRGGAWYASTVRAVWVRRDMYRGLLASVDANPAEKPAA